MQFMKLGNLIVPVDRIRTIVTEANGQVMVDIGGGPFATAAADGKALVDWALLNLCCKPAVHAEPEEPEAEHKAEKKAKK